MAKDLTQTDSLIAALPDAALLLCPRSDRILAHNDLARQMLQRSDLSEGRFSALLGPAMPRFLVFAEEVDYRGEAWTRDIPLQLPTQGLLRCEMRARTLPDQTGLLLLLTDLDAFEKRTQIAETESIFRAGFTEWKRAQTFFRELEGQNQLILEAAGEGIYGINSEGNTTFVNRAAQEMLGWSSADLLGKNIHDMIHHHHLNGDLYHHHDCPIYRTFRFDQAHRVEDEVFWRKDGKPIRVEYVSTPIYDQQILAGAVVIFRDVTQRKENERQLQEALTEIAALRDRLEQENAYLQETISTERAHHRIIGVSASIRSVVERINLVARTNTNVLITGESGTGKALIATEIHKASSHSRRSMIHFKCSSVAPEAVEAELFGQVRGAPNGATRDKAGKLEIAHGGTLFLDGIEDLPRDIQGKLLASLQSSTITRLGDTREKALELRVIASTALSEEEAHRSGRIRDDLYLFLNVFPISSLALRDRTEDVPPLAAHLLRVACRKLGRSVPTIPGDVMEQLQAYTWPGNVRELHNVMERAAIVSRGPKLQVEITGNGPYSGGSPEGIRTDGQMQALLRANLIAALRKTNGRISGANGAAALLEMRPTTVHSRVKAFAITESDWR